MITGIQITKANDQALLNSFWLLDDETSEARCVCAKDKYTEDQVVPVSDLGQIEYRGAAGNAIYRARGRGAAPERERTAS